MLRKLKIPVPDSFAIERSSKRALLRQAARHRDAGDWLKAAEDYRRFLELDPTEFATWVQLGHVLKEAKDYLGAMSAYERALHLNGTDHDLHLQIGHLYTVSGDPLRAREQYARAAALGSTDPHATRAVSVPTTAQELFREGDAQRDARAWSAAAAAYQSGLALEPSAFEIWVQLGHVCKELGSPERAEAAYLRAQELRFNDADLNLQLGHFYATRNDIARAADFYTRALALGLRDYHALAFLGERAGTHRSLHVALARLTADERRKQTILSAPNSPSSFARFLLLHTA